MLTGRWGDNIHTCCIIDDVERCKPLYKRQGAGDTEGASVVHGWEIENDAYAGDAEACQGDMCQLFMVDRRDRPLRLTARQKTYLRVAAQR